MQRSYSNVPALNIPRGGHNNNSIDFTGYDNDTSCKKRSLHSKSIATVITNNHNSNFNYAD